MLVSDVSAAALASTAYQQTTQRADQNEVQQASISSHARSAVDVAPTAVKAAGQLDTPQDQSSNADDQPAENKDENQNQDTETLTKELQEKLENLASDALGDENTKFSISFDDSSNRFIYQTTDKETGEVIKQYPSEEVLQQISKIREVRGLAFEAMV